MLTPDSLIFFYFFFSLLVDVGMQEGRALGSLCSFGVVLFFFATLHFTLTTNVYAYT